MCPKDFEENKILERIILKNLDSKDIEVKKRFGVKKMLSAKKLWIHQLGGYGTFYHQKVFLGTQNLISRPSNKGKYLHVLLFQISAPQKKKNCFVSQRFDYHFSSFLWNNSQYLSSDNIFLSTALYWKVSSGHLCNLGYWCFFNFWINNMNF